MTRGEGVRRRAIAGLVGAMGLVAACESAPDGEVETSPPPVLVEAARVVSGPFAETRWLPAEIAADETARVAPELAGRITWVCCDEGDSVRRGQTVARIDTEVAETELARSESELDHAERELRRIERLASSEAATQQDVDAARSRRDAARTAVDGARATLTRAVLRSPIDGRVVRRHAVAGELADPGAPILELARLDPIRVVAGLPERDLPHVTREAEVQVRLDAWPDRLLAGEVDRLGLVAGPARTFRLEILLGNEAGRLRPGMIGRVRITKRQYDDAVVVPQDAVIDEYDGHRVYVVEDGRAVERPVRLGPRNGRSVVVSDGLSAGDALVVTGHRFLTDGRAVEVARLGVLEVGEPPAFDLPPPALEGEHRDERTDVADSGADG